MSHAESSSQIQLDIGQPSDFEALMGLRREVFVGELGIQDETYRDVFSDSYSKNILLKRDKKIVGAVRVAFSRDQQEFYISYLVISKFHRKLSYLRLLFGAVIYILQVNGIRSVRADSTDQNLAMYLSLGCKIVGLKFRKYGFKCDWTPMRYVLGTNRERERKIVERAALLLGGSERLRWLFKPVVLSCEDQCSYDEALVRFIDSTGRAEIIPHAGASRLTTRSNVVVRFASAPDQAAEGASATRVVDLPSRFDRLNETLSREHVIAVNRRSAALSPARTYSVCTGKYLIYIDHTLDVAAIDQDHVKSVLWIADSLADMPNIARHLASHVDVPVGFVLAPSTAFASRALLSTFLDFLHPADAPYEPVHWIDLARASSSFSDNAAVGRDLLVFLDAVDGAEVGIVGKTHCIVALGAPGAKTKRFINALLSSGFPVGTAVRFANLACGGESGTPLIALGDPSVRLTAERPDGAQTVGDPALRAIARRHDCASYDSSSLLHVTWPRTEQLEPSTSLGKVIREFGAPLHTVSCADRDLQHMFLFGNMGRTEIAGCAH